MIHLHSSRSENHSGLPTLVIVSLEFSHDGRGLGVAPISTISREFGRSSRLDGWFGLVLLMIACIRQWITAFRADLQEKVTFTAGVDLKWNGSTLPPVIGQPASYH